MCADDKATRQMNDCDIKKYLETGKEEANLQSGEIKFLMHVQEKK